MGVEAYGRPVVRGIGHAGGFSHGHPNYAFGPGCTDPGEPELVNPGQAGVDQPRRLARVEVDEDVQVVQVLEVANDPDQVLDVEGLRAERVGAQLRSTSAIAKARQRRHDDDPRT